MIVKVVGVALVKLGLRPFKMRSRILGAFTSDCCCPESGMVEYLGQMTTDGIAVRMREAGNSPDSKRDAHGPKSSAPNFNAALRELSNLTHSRF